MRRRNLFALFIVICMLFMLTLPSLSACTTTAPQSNKIVLEALTYSTNQTKMFEDYCWDWFMDRVYAYSGGELVIEWKGGADVIEVNEQFEGLKNGLFDFLAIYSSAYEPSVPEGTVMNIVPAGNNGQLPEQVHSMLVDSHARENVYFLGLHKGLLPWNYWLTEKVDSLDDFSKLKIAAHSKAHLDTIEILGATPVNVPLADEYTGLDRGLVDGAAKPPFSVITDKTYEVVKYGITRPYNVCCNNVLLMNLESWNNLPDHLQQVITDVMNDYAADTMAYHIGKYNMVIEEIESMGVEMIEIPLNQEEAANWDSAFASTNWKMLKARLSAERYNEVKQVLESAGYKEPSGL